jgi:hypothetical protein
MTRESSGLELFKQHAVKKTGNHYSITGKDYVVTDHDCTCLDFQLRGKHCKHIIAVKLFMEGDEKRSDKKYTELITYMRQCDGIVPYYELYEKYDDLVDEALKDDIISRTAKQFVLI